MKRFVRRIVALLAVCTLVLCSCAYAQARESGNAAPKPGMSHDERNGRMKPAAPNGQRNPDKPENEASVLTEDVAPEKPAESMSEEKPVAPNGQQTPDKPDNGTEVPIETQAPEKPDETLAEDEKKPVKPEGKEFRKHRKHLDLNKLVEEGVISQEISDAIMNHMEQNKPDTVQEEPIDTTEPSEGENLPENQPELEAIDQLYADGMISEDVYTQLKEMFASSAANVSAEE